MNVRPQVGQIDLAQEAPFRLGVFEVRPATREIIAGAAREVLEPRVMQVLVALAGRRGEVVSREELIGRCWSGRAVGDDAINRCTGAVRKLASAYGGFSLETIARVGYRLAETPPLRRMPGFWQALKTQGRALPFFAVALILVAAGLVVWLLRPAEEKAPPPARLSIAVLPFTPPAGDREAEQLGDAIATSIADALVREGLDVISPAKTRLYRGASKADAAQALHADFVIDGEIRREGGMLKVPLRTIETATGTILVADSVEAQAADAAMLPELATAAALSCGWGLLSSLNPAEHWNLRVIAGSLQVIRHLSSRSEDVYAYGIAKQLAAEEPGDSYAQYLYAMSAATFMPSRIPGQRLPLLLEARAAAKRTLQLDPEFGEAYLALARVTPQYDWAVREGYLRQGLRLRASSPLSYMDLLALYMNAGYLQSGGRMAEESFSSHPPFDNTIFEAINARLWLGDPGGARQLIARALKLYPKRVAFAAKMFEATAFNGAPDEAASFLKDPAAAPLLQPQGEGRTYAAIVAALRSGRLADVKTVVDDCMNLQGRTHEFRRSCFMALIKLRRLDDAFRLAESLYPDQRGATAAERERRWLARMPFNTVYLVIPATAPLRADPRYRDLAERVGLLQYWKESGQAPDFCATEKAPVCALLT
jgi:DNA-binding winged helix-turn-helix (wHTH) protein/TolB-like protein